MKPQDTQRRKRWSIILAEGEGARTRSMIEQWLGFHKPKQFCTFVGQRSMLQHTWDRADHLTVPECKVTVMARAHHREAWSHLEHRTAGQVVLQPENRDTAAGIFLPLTYVRAWDPEATVVLYPSDHFVFPEDRFIEAVRRAFWAAEHLTDRVILLGVVPTSLELEYGWIEPGWNLGWSASSSVRGVRAFLEKPEPAKAKAAMMGGAPWNTLVLATKIKTLWDLGWQCVPELMGRFEKLSEAIGSPQEGFTLDAIYQDMPVRNFSSDLLQKFPERMGVIELQGVLWSDWGRPSRILETLQTIGKEPAFPKECLVAFRTVSADPRQGSVEEGVTSDITVTRYHGGEG